MEETDQYLVHYGVLGMKWGVRKDRRKAVKKAKFEKKVSDTAKSDLKKSSGNVSKAIKSRENKQFTRDAISTGMAAGVTAMGAFKSAGLLSRYVRSLNQTNDIDPPHLGAGLAPRLAGVMAATIVRGTPMAANVPVAALASVAASLGVSAAIYGINRYKNKRDDAVLAKLRKKKVKK